MKKKPFKTWEEVKKELDFTPEQEAEIQLEFKKIEKEIEIRLN